MNSLFQTPIRGLILDMDGVLWRGPQPIGDLPAIFARIQRAGLQVMLATNNAGRSPAQHLSHVVQLGVQGLEDWQVINSAHAAVDHLIERFPGRGSVYVIGETALSDMVSAAGFTPGEQGALAVIAGIDRSFTYAKLAVAQRVILDGGPFIATNTDLTFPIPGGVAPGAGSIMAAIQAASGTEPYVAGKPSPAMYQIALERMALAPAEVLVVGDRLETDIIGAQAIGCRTALVLSGVSTLEQAAAWRPAPDLILSDLSATLDALGIPS
jgi:4-nitrophenyl phosphatase